MRPIGIIGGMSWASSLEYYRILNQLGAQRLGGLHSAEIRLYSVDFGPIAAMLRAGDWDGLRARFADAARVLEASGAGLILLATNTMHLAADAITGATDLPFLHLVDVVGQEAQRLGYTRLGLLGTRATMASQELYPQRLSQRFGIEVLVPEPERFELIDRVIFSELCLGRVESASREAYLAIMQSLVDRGAQAIILGCTEIPLLVSQDQAPCPLLDTTRLHCEAAMQFALSEG